MRKLSFRDIYSFHLKFPGIAVKYKITIIANIFFHLEVNNITESF